MADYYTPTIVQPSIPVSDMTALERLLLSHVFSSESDGDCIYFYAWEGASDLGWISRAELESALAMSQDVGSEANSFVEDQIAKVSSDQLEIELDFSGSAWEVFLQDIVGRSQTLQCVTVVSSFTCSKMRPDGFGGMVVLITEDMIKGKSTNDILDDFLAEMDTQADAVPEHSDPYVLLQIDEVSVREAIPTLMETDETLTRLAPEAIQEADIRAACQTVVEQTDLFEEHGNAIFRAALGAIREAERRRNQLR